MINTPHIPVLLNEVLTTFESVDNGYLIDCTLGYGGHSSRILSAHPDLKLIGIDRDQEALDFSSHRLSNFDDRIELIKGDFATILPSIEQSPIKAVLADFGVSSLQLDKPERGFGFESDRLDMRMDGSSELSAFEVINRYSYQQLKDIFISYGEIREGGRLAQAIIEARATKPIESAKELSGIVSKVIKGHKKIHPATLAFQAIRIEVNDELGQIEGLLDTLEEMKPRGATIALITFHSLEDRLVKRRFQKWSRSCICDPDAPRCTCGNNHSLGKMPHRKPVTAKKDEIKSNPRSRSAKLRTFVFKEQ